MDDDGTSEDGEISGQFLLTRLLQLNPQLLQLQLSQLEFSQLWIIAKKYLVKLLLFIGRFMFQRTKLSAPSNKKRMNSDGEKAQFVCIKNANDATEADISIITESDFEE